MTERIVNGQHRQLGLPEKRDWGWLHHAKVKVTDIDALVSSRNGMRLLNIEFKSLHQPTQRVYVNTHQRTVWERLWQQDIDTWIVVEEDDHWLLMEYLGQQGQGEQRDRTGRYRIWYPKSEFQVIFEEDLIEKVEKWAR